MKSIRVLTLVLISFIEKGGHHDLVLAIRYNGYGPLILLWDLFFFGQYYISTKKIGTPLLQSQINLKDWRGNRNPFRIFFISAHCLLIDQNLKKPQKLIFSSFGPKNVHIGIWKLLSNPIHFWTADVQKNVGAKV